ncbi:MAG: T9SS type A sorting domain-containing protein [Sphingobacteriaceae bacterium]|nr:T9SS type A sorting domain-containing protein [Sphingobacteriaceae bacterium]
MNAAKAKNILKFYKNHEFPSAIPMDGEFRKAGKLPTKSKGLNSTNLKAYPNPAKDFVNFKMTGWHEVSTLLIYNAQGQMIQQIEIKPTGEIYMLNTANWPSGLYQYRLIKSNETISSGKIMITQ